MLTLSHSVTDPDSDAARGATDADEESAGAADLLRLKERARRPASDRQAATSPDPAQSRRDRGPGVCPGAPTRTADQPSAPRDAGLSVIVDTGCGEHIMSRADAVRLGHSWTDRAAAGRKFEGAGKTTATRWTVKYDLPELGETPDFWVMPQSPPLMSVGLRCMERGYSFVWPCGRAPYFVTPGAGIVECVVRGNIPYLCGGDERCQPRELMDEDLQVPVPGIEGVPRYMTVPQAEAMHGAPARRDLGRESVELAHLLTHTHRPTHIARLASEPR